MELFYPPDKCTLGQIVFLTVVYAKILFESSGLIANGSELLLLFPSVAGLVGSIVLPILGAVPDGIMVLFSGLGSDAQNQVSVGVGALAGSTVMLLTFPWFIAIISGKVNLGDDGQAAYGTTDDPPQSCFKQGVSYTQNLQKTAKIMIATTLLFVVIQFPASMEEEVTVGLDAATATKDQARSEKSWALTGMVAACFAFFSYLVYCFLDASEDKVLERVIEGIQKKEISIGAALKFAKDTSHTDGEEQTLSKGDQTRFKKIVRPFFAIYDANGNGLLEPSEFKNLLSVLGERFTLKAEQMIEDKNGQDQLSFDRVVTFLGQYLREENLRKVQDVSYNPRYMPKYEDDEEEEEMPEDLLHLTREQQLFRVGFRAAWMMGLGTVMVIIFSDPMVDVLSDWGRRLDISPFYISFVLAPLASNASELVSAYQYAQKKSQKSITTALSTLVGAACMNNTFCLAIFLALVYWKKLAWQFTAETLAIVVIQWGIGFLTIKKTTHTVPMAILILLCYPGCLMIVWFFENIVGWD